MIATFLFIVGAVSPLGPRRQAGDRRASTVQMSASADLEARVTSGVAVPEDLASLAIVYLGRVRSEADPTFIPKARKLIERSLKMQPDANPTALVAAASLANASHDFSEAVVWARRAIRENPHDEAPYGLLGDALVELGRQHEADAAYQKMVDTRPNVGSYVRASYAAQAHGDHDAALQAMKLALQATQPTGEEAAYLRHLRGDIYLSMRRYEAAEQENRTAMRIAPGYVPPTVGVAESLIAQGKLSQARRILDRAVEALPTIENINTLADLEWSMGDRDQARGTYKHAEQRLAAYRESGVLPDIDFILFYADRNVRLDAGLSDAKAVYANRPTAGAADALAWMLHAAGDDVLAARYSKQALEADPPSALHHFHAGVIAEALARHAEARVHLDAALEIDPVFSLVHRSHAVRLLERLGNSHDPAVPKGGS